MHNNIFKKHFLILYQIEKSENFVFINSKLQKSVHEAIILEGNLIIFLILCENFSLILKKCS